MTTNQKVVGSNPAGFTEKGDFERGLLLLCFSTLPAFQSTVGSIIAIDRIRHARARDMTVCDYSVLLTEADQNMFAKQMPPYKVIKKDVKHERAVDEQI